MLVGVMSDSHDRLDGLKKAVEIFKQKNVEMIIHAGDWVSPYTLDFFDELVADFPIPVKSVIGNNPGDLKRIFRDNPQKNNPIEWPHRVTLAITIGNKQGIIYHGEDREILNALIDGQKYDVIFTGHTHTVRNEMIGKTLVLNPGSVAYASEGKMLDKASVAIYVSKTNQAEIIYFS